MDAKWMMALRRRSGAGLADCKAAFEAVGDDLDAAERWLRELALGRILERSGAARADAEAAFAQYGWNLELAANHARQRALYRSPALAEEDDAADRLRRVARAERVEDLLAVVGPDDEASLRSQLEVLAAYENAAESHPDGLFADDLAEAAGRALEAVGAIELAGALRQARAASEPGLAFDQEGFFAGRGDLVRRLRALF